MLNFAILLYYYLADATVDTDCRVKVLETAKANILKAQKNQKIAYDRKHSCPHTFQLQALVLKKDFTRKKRKGGKLDCKWVGPYRIIADLGRGLYKLVCIQNPLKIIKRVNGVHLKEYHNVSLRQGFIQQRVFVGGGKPPYPLDAY